MSFKAPFMHTMRGIHNPFLIALAVIMLCCTQARAMQWGVMPFPKNALKGRPADLIESVKLANDIPAPLSVNVTGWKDLEPSKEEYNLAEKLGGFHYTANQGMVPYFGIALINTVKRDMPDDLTDLAWDDPKLLERFRKLMEGIRTQLTFGIPYFIIGNEVDVYFENHPAEVESFLVFYAKAREVVKSYYPTASVGITVTMEGLTKPERKALVLKALALSDKAFFTFYPLFDLKLTPLDQTDKYLDAIIEATGGKDVILQEVGYPSSPSLGSSEEHQAKFFEKIIPAIAKRPQIKAASIFLMHDLEPELCKTLTAYYGLNNILGLSDKFQDFLCSLGLRTYDGTPKVAWETVVKQLKAQE